MRGVTAERLEFHDDRVVKKTPAGNSSCTGRIRLKIVHVVRSPIGGIFRHIVDLVDAQATAGHEVGIVCNSSTGGRFEDAVIASVARSSRSALHVFRCGAASR